MKFVIDKVEDTEQHGVPLVRITALGFGSICVDCRTRRRPEVGDELVPHYGDDVGNWVSGLTIAGQYYSQQ